MHVFLLKIHAKNDRPLLSLDKLHNHSRHVVLSQFYCDRSSECWPHATGALVGVRL